MIQIPLSPDRYKAAIAHVIQVPQSNDLLSYRLPTADDPVGQLVTAQVSLEFTYDPNLELPRPAGQGPGALSANILEKRGLARFASEGTIKAHLIDLLGHV